MTDNERKFRLTGVALKGDNIKNGEDILDLGTEELRGGSKRVPVLLENALFFINVHLFFRMVGAGSEGGSIQKVVDCPSHLGLTGVGSAFVMDARIERCLGSEKSFNAYSSENLRKQREVDSIIES